TYCHSHFQLVLVDYFAVGQCVPFIIQKMMSTDFSINTKYHRTIKIACSLLKWQWDKRFFSIKLKVERQKSARNIVATQLMA
ncbi:hypothetical protein, partial [Levilactobacillus angrenensis]